MSKGWGVGGGGEMAVEAGVMCLGGGGGCGEVRVGRWGGVLGPVVSFTQERAAPGEGLATHRSTHRHTPLLGAV